MNEKREKSLTAFRSYVGSEYFTRADILILKETAYNMLNGMRMSSKWDVSPDNEEDMLNMVKAVYSSGTESIIN